MISKTVDDIGGDSSEGMVNKNTCLNQLMLFNRNRTKKTVQHSRKIGVVGKRVLWESENNTKKGERGGKNMLLLRW